MKSKTIIIALVLGSIGVSCSTESISLSNEDNIPSLIEVYLGVTKEVDRQIILQNNSTIRSTHEDALKHTLLNLNNFDSKDNSNLRRAESPNISFGGIPLTRPSERARATISNSSTASTLFGSTVDITVSENTSNARNSIKETKSMYVPKLINFDSDLNTIRTGTEITWNEDANNHKGVIIRLEYHPQLQSNQEIANAYTHVILKGEIVSDNGSIIIENDLVSDFPVGASIKVTLARGNMSFMDANDDEIGAYAVTSSSAMPVVQ